MSNPAGSLLGVGLALWLLLMGFFVGYQFGHDAVEREAVKNSSAEWMPDADGNAQLRWK